tara:strand:- start:244 stop:1131 length:888 start_codon:yes stop_codon:yes gene_type:complete
MNLLTTFIFITYLLYIIYISYIYNNLDKGKFGKIILSIFGIVLFILALIYNYYGWSTNKIAGIWLFIALASLYSIQTYSITQCKDCTGKYEDTSKNPKAYDIALKNHQRYIMIKSTIAIILFSIVGYAIKKLETNLCDQYIFISILLSYSIFIVVENISYLKPEFGFIRDPKLLMTEKFQDTSIIHIIVIAIWIFGALIILNDFHQTKLYNNITSPYITTPQFGGGNVINYSTYVILIYIIYNYFTSKYMQNNCGEWNYNNLQMLNNLRKINVNMFLNIIILFSIFISFGQCKKK